MPNNLSLASCLGGRNLWLPWLRQEEGWAGWSALIPPPSRPPIPPLQLWLEGKGEKRQTSFLPSALNEVTVPVWENYIRCFNSFLWTLHLGVMASTCLLDKNSSQAVLLCSCGAFEAFASSETAGRGVSDGR